MQSHSEHIVRQVPDAGPIVALETAVLTHGLPHPAGLETVGQMAQAIRDVGAVPAIIGVVQGKLVIGCTIQQCETLIADASVAKTSARDLAVHLGNPDANAGTTVAATLTACRMAHIAVMATGGIGGVHRGWQQRPDISADLHEMSFTPTCVIASGCKSILDIPATLEALESRSIPVIGYRTRQFPQFHSRGSDDLPVPHRIEEVREAVRICQMHWHTLAQTTSVLLANPVPDQQAIEHDLIDSAIETAIGRAASLKITGPALTPFLLSALEEVTQGRSLEANTALLVHNASLAGHIAVAMHTASAGS